jgi:hypothetical protein
MEVKGRTPVVAVPDFGDPETLGRRRARPDA